ncbi:MAG TPA: GNAT family protein [Tetrasphaera sp.]|uniref:GNAT family N-acetyltransferase n=1 Tax=Nostocoides sp. TaxID=1917966 RepID=UPI002D1C8B47|nr:GNAT family protein [Tetrasphaera sp.]HNQ06233.1 GNAT family protein [Tetrasphaera sp.]
MPTLPTLAVCLHPRLARFVTSAAACVADKAPCELRDGTPAWIFPLLPTDREQLAAEFEELSPDSVRRRFLRPVVHLTEEMLRHLVDDVDGIDHVALVLAVDVDHDLVPVAIARIVRYADQPESADLAVTVKDDWQDLGCASLLLRELIARRPVGVTRIVTEVLIDNPASLAMLRRLGPTQSQPAEGGVYDVVVDLSGSERLSGDADEPIAPLLRPEHRERRRLLQTRDLVCPWFA